MSKAKDVLKLIEKKELTDSAVRKKTKSIVKKNAVLMKKLADA